MAFMQDPSFQTIRFKGLKLVLAKRGIPPGKNQAENIAALQTCDDFSPRKAYDKAHNNKYHQYDERERSCLLVWSQVPCRIGTHWSDSGCG